MSKEDTIEFRQQWSSASGQLSATRGVQNKLMQRACEAFSIVDDKLAKAFRDFAAELQPEIDRLSAQVQQFIQQSQP